MIEGLLGLLGAIGAALVAGGVGLLSLLIAKDQKTSEFRQAWIDSLRSDLAEHLACGSQLFARYSHLYSVYHGMADFRSRLDGLVESCAELKSGLERTRTSLLLRINPVDDLDFVGALRSYHDLVEIRPPSCELELKKAEALLMEVAQVLLKREWRRVKSGEPLYYITKWSSLAAVLIGILVFLALVVSIFLG